MTDHSDLIERLRAAIDLGDRTGSRGKRPENIYNVADEALTALSSQSLSLSEAREEIERLKDFGGDAVDLAGRILENLGIGQDASREPGADRRRDRIAAMIQRSFDAAPRGKTLEALRTAERLNAAAKRGKADGRVFIDYRDWEAFLAEVRSVLEDRKSVLADATPNPPLSDLSSLRKGAEVLTDPIAVHANMLRGTIAKPSLNNIAHLYPEVRQMKQALLATLKHFRWPTSAEHETRDKVMAALAPFDDPPMTPGSALVSGSREEQ